MQQIRLQQDATLVQVHVVTPVRELAEVNVWDVVTPVRVPVREVVQVDVVTPVREPVKIDVRVAVREALGSCIFTKEGNFVLSSLVNISF